MKTYQLVLDGNLSPFSIQANDWLDAMDKMSIKHDWFAWLIGNCKSIRVSFEEIK